MIDYKKTLINNIDDWIVFNIETYITILNKPSIEPKLFQGYK